MAKKEETPEQIIAAAAASAANKVAAAQQREAEANEKLLAQGSHLDAAREEIAELGSRVVALESDLAAAQARVSVNHGATNEVVLVRPAPFNGKTLSIGTVIGTISPLEGETTDYVVDAVRGGFAKCVACEPTESDDGEQGGGSGGGQKGGEGS